MTVRNHAVVWVDHRVAKVFYLGLEAVDERAIYSDLATPHLHHKANTIGSGKVEDDPTFFPRIDEALEQCEAVLIVGPGNEKTLLQKHLKASRRFPEDRDLRTKPCDHPTDREIVAPGRRHFHLGEPAR
jgi:hypothetical protein